MSEAVEGFGRFALLNKRKRQLPYGGEKRETSHMAVFYRDDRYNHSLRVSARWGRTRGPWTIAIRTNPLGEEDKKVRTELDKHRKEAQRAPFQNDIQKAP